MYDASRNEDKGFSGHQRPFRTAPATVTHHAYLQHYRHLRARPHRRERCHLRRRHQGRCGPGWRPRRLSGTSPRAFIIVLCRSLRERSRRARARARRAGDRLTSRACACVRARVRDESSAIHALLCARAARPLTFPPRRLSVADRLPLRGQLPRHLLHRFPRQRDGRHQALLHR